MRPRRFGLWATAIAALGAVGLLAVGAVRRPAETAATRGAELARELGCFACHGAGGSGGVPNPGSADGEVPGWDPATAALYIADPTEIAQWILDGRPARLSAVEPTGLVEMPAYRDHLSDAELTDLIAYFRAVSGIGTMPPAAEVGRRTAARLGCFGCHGPGGRAGSPNPRGWKGVVPAWDSADFAELVRDDDELRAWILDGAIPRLRDDVIARQFLDRQPIQMPAYRSLIDDAELAAIVAYVHWLRGSGDNQAAP